MAKLATTLMNDAAAKAVFDEHHTELLRAMVADMLGMEPAEITGFALLNVEVSAERLGGKSVRLDLHMRVNGERVCLELQNGHADEYLPRSLYYWARLYTRGLGAGENYSTLRAVTVISVLGFRRFAGDSFRSYHVIDGPLRLRNKSEQQDSPAFPWLRLTFFELPKVPALDGPPSEYTDTPAARVVLWLRLFLATTDAELEAIESMGVKAVNNTIARFRYVLDSQKLQDALLQQEMRRLDERTAKAKAKAAMAEALAGARAEGETRGVAKGEASGVAKGRVQDILTVLEHRDVTLTRAQRKRILRCTHPVTLDAWFRRALTVTDAASLFDTLPGDDLAHEAAAS